MEDALRHGIKEIMQDGKPENTQAIYDAIHSITKGSSTKPKHLNLGQLMAVYQKANLLAILSKKYTSNFRLTKSINWEVFVEWRNNAVHRKTEITELQATQMLILQDDEDRVLLHQRPPTGLWGGLWGFPEAQPQADIPAFLKTQYGLAGTLLDALPRRRHSFSHFHLDIHPQRIRVENTGDLCMEDNGLLWYNPRMPANVGLAAPVSRLRAELKEAEEQEK